ncbi:MAG TPA: hypothetical protein VIA63_07750, partial [Candidatus Limnocylindria bacterium]
MSGTLRIAGLLAGIVLALGLIGPAVLAGGGNIGNVGSNIGGDTLNTLSQAARARITGATQTQTQTSNNNTESENEASHFGNGNTATASGPS